MMKKLSPFACWITLRTFVAFAGILSFLFIGQNIAELQTTEKIHVDEKTPTIVHASDRGHPYVNFEDGRGLAATNLQAISRSQPVAEVEADFDSDGIPDIVLADAAGRLSFLHGNRSSPAPIEKNAEQKISGSVEDIIFDARVLDATLGISPDHMFAGDYNADGKPDILAATVGSSYLVLVISSGEGHFSRPVAINAGGKITTIESGEIGRRDGQADVAVGYTNRNGSFLAVYEHPEGAFTHKAEITKLPSAATSITIGNLDTDFYADVAVACGSDLTIIQGRGQVYPWDVDPKPGISRPQAAVATRKMPVTISAMTVGRFGQERGQILALLGTDGNIYKLESHRFEKRNADNDGIKQNQKLEPVPFLPIDGEVRNVATFAEPTLDPELAGSLGIPTIDASEVRNGNLNEFLQKKQEAAFEKYKKADKRNLENREENQKAETNAQSQRAKKAFLRSIAGKPSTFSSWKLEALTMGSQFSNAAAFNLPNKMMRVNVSDSDLDDIAIVDRSGNKIQLVSQVKPSDENGIKTDRPIEISTTTLETTENPIAILPMRLNRDALSDLIVLTTGSSVPSVVMSGPSALLLVSTTDDTIGCQPDNPCSLRGAINYANSHSGVELIQFITGPATFALSSELPVITDAVTLFGNTNEGGQPTIEISGINAPAPANGLSIRSSNSLIFGLAINSFKSTSTPNGQSQVGGNGIAIYSNSAAQNVGNNVVLQTYLGTDRSGSLDMGNDATGLNIFDSDNNEIVQNLLSGNGSRQKGGVGIALTDGNSNTFVNNIIGLNSLGTAKLGNNEGLFFAGSDNKFGGDGVGDGNTVSGNGLTRLPTDTQPGCDGSGMRIPQGLNLDTGELLTLNNTLKGNRFGTNPAGTLGLGNCWVAIDTLPLTQTVIGSIAQDGRNIISDNGRDAIYCSEAVNGTPSEGGYCVIVGNNIGTDITGANALPNDWRNQRDGLVFQSGTVVVANNLTLSNVGAPGNTTPGGACTGFCNLISGNGGDGISLYRLGYGEVGIFNNFIGTNQSGTAAIPGANTGIEVEGIGATYVGLGSTTQPLGNLISGNYYSAVQANGFGNSNIKNNLFIQGNLIGTDTTGTFAVPNVQCTSCGYYGSVFLLTLVEDQITVGGPNFEDRNIISGNFDHGITVNNFAGGHARVMNNLVGLNKSLLPLGNKGVGVFMGNLSNFGTVIGGSSAEEGNQIAYNGTGLAGISAGVVLRDGYGVTIRNNLIHDNSGLGIDLKADGVTQNDCLDGDIGANGLQNYPSLFAPTQNGDGGTDVTGYLRSSAANDFVLDFYSNSTPDPTGYGEGSVYIGSKQIHTNSNGFTTFTYSTTADNAANITATATDSFGNTSEFSCVAGQCVDIVRNIEEAEAMLATTICAEPIVVNTTGDQHDADLADAECDVDTDNEGLQCTLRAAIEEAEHQAGANAITFNIPGEGLHGIVPQTPLPILTQPVSIDASTQPGYTGVPTVVLDGNATTGAYGFAVRGGNSLIKGFSVVNFKEQVGISGSSGNGQNRIGGNYIGVYPTGAVGDPAKQLFGITLVAGAINNQIGGFRPENRNVIGGNGQGISVSGGSTNNTLVNNYVGIAADGVSPISNRDGIVILQSDRNNIGGFINDAPNVVSFNQESGIYLTGSSSNRVSGNLIGTTADGNLPAGNKRGVNIDGGSAYNIIGGTTANERNVISGQNSIEFAAGVAIRPDAGTSNTVAGNYIGVSLNADAYLPNRVGIAVNADDQIIGNSSDTNFRNLIVAAETEDSYGIYLHALAPNDELRNVTVQNNTIGTLNSEVSSLGQIGVYLTGNVTSCTVKGNTIGHQRFAGIRLFDGPHNNTISGNRVGIKTDNGEIPNYNGIAIRQADTNFIRDNVVSGNSRHGIVIGDTFGQSDRPAPAAERANRPTGTSGSFAINNIVTGNKVGTTVEGDDVISNGAVGIGIGENARDNTIGGAGPLGNIVGGSTGELGYGIFVGVYDDSTAQELLPQNNKIKGNYVGVGTGSKPAALANNYGIYVRNAVSTTIGGESAAEGNIVGFNHINGVKIFNPTTTETTVENNLVGVTPNGESIGNEGDGIVVDGAVATLVQQNTVGWNAGFGLSVTNISDDSFQRHISARKGILRPNLFNLKAIGNMLGSIASGVGKVLPTANLSGGAKLEDVTSALIGQLNDPAKPNIFSGNGGPGLILIRCTGTQIFGGFYGTDPSAATGIGNIGPGIEVSDSKLTEVRQATVAGNDNIGLYAHDLPDDASGNAALTVSETNIGVVRTDSGAVIGVKNALDGMKVKDVGKLLIGIQGLLQNRRKNIFSNNGGYGLAVDNSDIKSASESAINHTIFGTDELGMLDLGNHRACVLLENAGRIAIGSVMAQLQVTMAGCAEEGLKMAGNRTNLVSVINTLIGVAPDGSTALGNGRDGVLISEGANQNKIGGPGENEGNTIAFNAGAGVNIDPTAGQGNVVDPNSIYGNAGLGIDIGSPGHTPNDANDADEGPNRGQNYPEILSYSINEAGELRAAYRVNTSPANATYPLYCEFFIADPSGEGKTFLAYDYYSEADHAAGSSGSKNINFGLATDRGWVQGDKMTASATDADSNTSEFFPTSVPTAAGVEVSGRILMSEGGRGLRGAAVTLTDNSGNSLSAVSGPNGTFVFHDVAAGHTYVVKVNSRRFNFDPRILQINDDIVGLSFIPTP